jgi:polysaccharide deacetylase 2 family uncharacterized protein YibQ
MLLASILSSQTHAQLQLTETDKKANIVLIIDDMGNNLELGQQAIALPGAINYAFLPHSPHSRNLATAAHLQRKEVLLHAPMSNLQSHPTGPGALKPIMNREEFLQTLKENLASIPYARGINNHMGSLLTQLHQPMDWLMRELKLQQKYFIDSRTSPRTIAAITAKKHQLPSLKRDIFLDNNRSEQAIDDQFKKLIQLAKNQQLAVAIGHPYPETLAYLKRELPLLEEQGINLVLASSALKPANCETTIAVVCSKPPTLANNKTQQYQKPYPP